MPANFKMSLEYYTRNLDQLQANSSLNNHNAVIDVLLSDQTSSSGDGNNESVLTINAAGDEYELQHDDLIGAEIVLLFRDGLNWYETSEAFTMADKEFQFDSNTGTITYPTDPFPPLQANEKTNVLYIAAGGSVVVSEPITLEQAKSWLKVEVDNDDEIIDVLITAARIACEGYTGISFVERSVTAILNNSLGNIKLPYGPINNVTSVTDIEGTDVSGYTITGVAHKRLLSPVINYVEVEYTAGYFSLPQHFKTALKEQLTWMYQHRGDDVAADISPTAKLLLRPYRSVC